MSGMDQRIKRRKWTPRRIALLAGIGVLAFFVARNIVSATGGTTLRVHAERARISTVIEGEFQEFIPVVGTVIPITTHYLDAVEGGRVTAIEREAGSFVQEGDPILELGNTDLLLDIMYREAELFQQSNNLRNTKITMEQNRLQMHRELLEIDHQIQRRQRICESQAVLMKDDLVARQDYEDSEDELSYLLRRRDLLLAAQRQDSLFRAVQIQHLEEALDRMQTNLGIVRQNAENLVVRAPVSGQLTSLSAEIGQSKARGERLGQIDVLDGFKVRAAVDQHYITRIHPGLEGTLSFADRTYRVVIDKVYPEVLNGRFEVDLLFQGEEPGGIRRGQTFNVRLELGDSSQAVLVPTGGFYQTTGGRWVYVLDESGRRAHRREIALGRRNTEYCEVLSGLAPGDHVITSSYENYGNADHLVLR